MPEHQITTQEAESLPPGYRMTELGALPAHWQVVRLGEVATVHAGGPAPQGKHYFEGGKYPFVRVQHLDADGLYVKRWDLITDAAVSHYRLKKFPSGTIVFPKSGAAIRLEKRAVLPVDAYIVSHLCAVLPKDENVNTWFLFSILRAKRLSEGKAEGYPVLNLSEVREVPVPFPSLPEQRAIAHVLRTVQEAKEATERVIAALRELKKSLMRHLFTYGPVPVDAIDRVELQETEIGPLPAHWRVVELGEVASFTMGQSPPSSTYNTSGEGLPFLQGKAEFGEVYPTPVKWCSQPKKVASHGSILISVRAPVGDVNIANEDYCIGRGLAAINGNEVLNNWFLFYLLIFTNRRLEDSGTGSIFKSINKGVLQNFLIPLPPLPKQREIARMLQAVDGRIEAEEKKKAALEALFKTLLHHLMTAKFRLPVEFISQFEEVK